MKTETSKDVLAGGARSVVVRPAAESDAAGLVALRRKLFAETQFMLPEREEFTWTAKDEARRILLFSARPNALILVAQDDRKLVATLTAVGDEFHRLRHSATFALGVAKSHWNRGIASRMVAETVAWSRSVGIRRLDLTVATTNLPAMTVALRAGFQVEGVRRSSLLLDEKYVDEYLMSVIHAT